MAKQKFKTEVSELLHLIIHSLYSNKGIVLACINELCLLFFNAHCIKIRNELNKADAHTIIIIVFKRPLKTNDISSESARTSKAIFKPKNSIE